MKYTASVIGAALVASCMVGGGARAGDDYMLLAHPEAIDGGSFTDDFGNRYRLFAVDAPELDQQCVGADGEKYACGQEAREALAKLITGILTCDPVDAGTADMRAVRCHDFAGRDIGSRLIAEGWAVPDRSATARLDYVWDEMEAEARARGMWQGRFVRPARWRAGVRL